MLNNTFMDNLMWPLFPMIYILCVPSCIVYMPCEILDVRFCVRISENMYVAFNYYISYLGDVYSLQWL